MDFDNPYATDDTGAMNLNSGTLNKLPEFSKISSISKHDSKFTMQTRIKEQLGPVETIKEEKPGDDEDVKK